MKKIKIYCVKNVHYKRLYNAEYSIEVRDAAKPITPTIEKLMATNTVVTYIKDNEFNSLKLIDTREGTSFYFIVGIMIEDKLGIMQINHKEITDIFPNATMLDGELIGSFKFIQTGSRTVISAVGDQNVGYCKYWLNKYKDLNIFSNEELEGIFKLLTGTTEDSNIAKILIESKKGEYYKQSFGN